MFNFKQILLLIRCLNYGLIPVVTLDKDMMSCIYQKQLRLMFNTWTLMECINKSPEN